MSSSTEVEEEFQSYLLVLHYTWLKSISRKFCWVFFPRINLSVLLCGCACLSFSDPFVYGYDVMMISVFRSYITIEILTWYQSHPERSLCAIETLLQLQLLEIRVSCLKTLEGKIQLFWNFFYNQSFGKDRGLKFNKTKMYYVYEFQTHIHYTLGDMVPPKKVSCLFRNSGLKKVNEGESLYLGI